MKKFLKVEVAVLALLVAAAAAVCIFIGISAGKTDPDVQAGPAPVTTQSTELTTEPTTEPAPTWLVHSPGRQLTASQYFVYDLNAGCFLTISGEPTERIYPASITKLFTAYAAMQYLNPDDLVSVGDELDFVAYKSSVADLEKGDVLTVAQLVEGLLLPSGNDAAQVLAVAAGRVMCADPQADEEYARSLFMSHMNDLAKQSGMSGTHFSNPDGVHNKNHYTNMTDLVAMANLCLSNARIMESVQKCASTVTPETGALKQWENSNELILPDSEYYCPYATGLKTGNTPSAGKCLLSSFEKDGRRLLIGVFGCPEKEDRFDDTLQLFNEAMGIT